MSLEAVIQENTAVMRELIARLTTGAIAQSAAIQPTAAPAAEAKTEAQAEEKKPAATPAAQETKTATGAPAAESRSEAAALDYTKDVKPLLVKVSTAKGRDALVGLLGKFGVAKGDQLAQDQLAAVIAEVNELLAA